MMYSKVIAVLTLWLCPSLAARNYCPPTGPVLPPPSIPPGFGCDLVSKLAKLNSTSPPWNFTTTSFSVEITSKEKTFLQYHYTAEAKDKRGVQTVDTNTVYRVASISKAINVYLLLIQAPELLEQSIVKYIPELKDFEEYKDITFRMLASQLSGMWRGEVASDLVFDSGNALQNIGFPKPDPKDIPTCDSVTTGVACTRAEFFSYLRNSNLTWMAGDRAAYASGSYTLIGYALENMTGKPFEQLLEESITKPLGLNATSLDAPSSSRGIILPGFLGQLFEIDVGTMKTTAGMYSSPSDLSRLLRSIFNHELLSPTRVRQWLKPAAFSGSFSSAVGMPWEIFRMWHLTPDNRPIDVYAKSGLFPVYGSYIILLPDYEIGITILVSSETPLPAVRKISDLIIQDLVPGLDKLAKEQAEASYAGLYTASSSTTESASELSLSVDDGPGLRIDRWTNNGHSILDFVVKRAGRPGEEVEARLYPVGEKNRWRLGVESVTSTDEQPSVFTKACQTWLRVDQLRYASLPVDEFVFSIEEGSVVGVENLGLRAKLVKSNLLFLSTDEAVSKHPNQIYTEWQRPLNLRHQT